MCNTVGGNLVTLAGYVQLNQQILKKLETLTETLDSGQVMMNSLDASFFPHESFSGTEGIRYIFMSKCKKLRFHVHCPCTLICSEMELFYNILFHNGTF